MSNALRGAGTSRDFIDDVDLMFERRVVNIEGNGVLGYWCTLCRADPSKSQDSSFFPGEDISTLRKHIAQSGDVHYSTYLSRCKAAGVGAVSQCNPSGAITDDDTEEMLGPIQLQQAFEKANLLAYFTAVVATTPEMTIDAICHPAFYDILRLGREPMPDDRFPNRNDVLRDIKRKSNRIRPQLSNYLKGVPGKTSVSVTIIKYGGIQPYIAVAAHWLNEDWKPEEAGLVFKEFGYNYFAGEVADCVLLGLKRLSLDKETLGWFIVHNDDEKCMGDALRVIANKIDPDGTTWRPHEMGTRSADCVVDDAVRAFMNTFKPTDETSLRDKLKELYGKRGSILVNVPVTPGSLAGCDNPNQSDMDIVDLSNTSAQAGPSSIVRPSVQGFDISKMNFTLGKLFVLCKRMRSHSSAYDYYEYLSEEAGIKPTLFNKRLEWSARHADLLETLFAELMKSKEVYNKFTTTADEKIGVKKLKNGEKFGMFAMDDDDWHRLAIIQKFLSEQYVAASSLDNERDQKRCPPPTIITAMQMLEGFRGKLMRLIEQTRCEGAKKGIMDAVKTIDGVLGREEEEGTENSNTANGKEIGRLVVGNSCFFATVLDPRVKLAYYKKTMDVAMYRDKVKALEELFMRYYAQVPAQRETSSHRNQRSDRRSLRGRSSDEIDDSDDSGTGDDDDSRDEASGEGGGEASEDSLDDVVNSFGGLLYEERDRGERDYGTSWFMAFTAERVAKQDANGPKRELFAYLDSPLEFGDGASVGGRNILEWWATHSQTYPTLSRIARDILAVPGLTKLGIEMNKKFHKRTPGTSRRMDIPAFEDLYIVKAGYDTGLISTEGEKAKLQKQMDDGVFNPRDVF